MTPESWKHTARVYSTKHLWATPNKIKKGQGPSIPSNIRQQAIKKKKKGNKEKENKQISQHKREEGREAFPIHEREGIPQKKKR
jgi:hypothetical protein